MKRQFLLTRMLLLFALIVGSVNGWADNYVKVTSASDLVAGDEYVISDGSLLVTGFGTKLTNTNTGFSVSGNTITTTTAEPLIFTLGTSSTKYTLAFEDNNTTKYLGGSTSSGSKTNFISATSVSTDNYKWTISASGVISTTGYNSTTRYIAVNGSSIGFYTNDYSKCFLYKKQAAVVVTSLSIASTPSKVRYENGETLDMTGFSLNADGNIVTEGYTMKIDDTTVTSGSTSLTSTGKKAITVAYGGKEVSQNISVGAVTSIAVTTAPTKTEYDTGDSFDATGMVITASLSTGEVSEPDTWTKVVTGYTVDPEDNLTPSDDEVTITYATKTTTQAITVTDVAVTGVSLNKASTTIEKTKTETLTPTFTPANATNKAVSWESDATGVATVSAAGVVTAVAAGTANITVTTNDGGYQATCVVTVVEKKGSAEYPYSVADVIEMNPGTTASEEGVYIIGYIAGCVNGSNGALNPATPVNSNLALVDDPNNTSSYISVQLASGDFRTNFNVVDHPYLVGVTQLLIKADIIKYCGIPGLKNIDEINAVAEAITVTNAGYATYASDFGLDYSGIDVKAYKATVSGTTISFDKVTEVPAGEGVLLQNEGTFVVPVKSVAAWADNANAFIRGTGAAVASGVGPFNYILNKVDDVVGFYKANGQTVAANRAYLQSTTNNARIGLSLDDETTGIEELKNSKTEELKSYYNLNGQRVANPSKGLYIVNGKKVIIK